MNTRRAPLPAQSNGSQPPSSDRVGARPRTSGDTGAAGHGLTRRAMVLAVGTAVTAAISQALDEADPVKGQYTLEVSTPGAERELTTLRHFRRAVGHSARVRTADDEFTGVVTAADADGEADEHNGGMVGIEVDGVEHRIALGDITEARMVVAGL